jgi:NADH:ubiquinone oxidoreductase subunit F (NADH-binding)
VEVYRRNGGYEAIRKVLDSMAPDDVINEVKSLHSVAAAARFPDRHEWSFVPRTRLKKSTSSAMPMNPELGTFKDRYLDGTRSAHADRRHADCRVRPGREDQLSTRGANTNI